MYQHVNNRYHRKVAIKNINSEWVIEIAYVSTDQQLCFPIAQGVPILQHNMFNIVADDQHFDRALGFQDTNLLSKTQC